MPKTKRTNKKPTPRDFLCEIQRCWGWFEFAQACLERMERAVMGKPSELDLRASGAQEFLAGVTGEASCSETVEEMLAAMYADAELLRDGIEQVRMELLQEVGEFTAYGISCNVAHRLRQIASRAHKVNLALLAMCTTDV